VRFVSELRERQIELLMKKFGYTRNEAEALINDAEQTAPSILLNPKNAFLLTLLGLGFALFFASILGGERKRRRRRKLIV